MKKEIYDKIKESYREYRLLDPKAISNFSRFKAGYLLGYSSKDKEIEEWKNEFYRVDNEKDDLLLELRKIQSNNP